ncbi:hypothetical protein CYLTODRAFT_415456 [Cylindrobasidium torrendii FP15055 ss-10]|uniref:Uncharacterized protein n=1 Tax=Cylindrobasidium torrendii FP15055 ss-10 TaxID=1314674 RepID=A0A0D7AU79_9AGAR|nr:hypothetical protein CYLTODRAFT_415456 [Cylindrobasidium torrendii FP15055 ss-10]
MVESTNVVRDRRLRDQLARLVNYAPELNEAYIAAVGGWLEWIPDEADEGEAHEVFAARVHALKLENQTKANAQREWEARYAIGLTIALEGSIEAAAAAASRSHPPSGPSSPFTPIPATLSSAPVAAAVLEPDSDTSAPLETLETTLNYLHDMATIKALTCAAASGNVSSEFFEAYCPKQPTSAPSGLQDLIRALQQFARVTTDGTTMDDAAVQKAPEREDARAG